MLRLGTPHRDAEAQDGHDHPEEEPLLQAAWPVVQLGGGWQPLEDGRLRQHQVLHDLEDGPGVRLGPGRYGFGPQGLHPIKQGEPFAIQCVDEGLHGSGQAQALNSGLKLSRWW